MSLPDLCPTSVMAPLGATPSLGDPLVCLEVRRRPAEGSARAAVLGALEAGHALTSGDALRDIGTSRLAADVHALKEMGWPIVSRDIEVVTRRGRLARVAEYYMVRGRES